MLDWIRENDVLLWWLGAASVVMFIGSLIAVPILIVRLPADYFAGSRRHQPTTLMNRWRSRMHPVLRAAVIAVKNLLGVVFLIGGLAMLALPGQGVLAIVIGLSLMDFPGKHRLQRWIVCRRSVLRTINWMRQRANRPPLIAPGGPDDADIATEDAREDEPESACGDAPHQAARCEGRGEFVGGTLRGEVGCGGARGGGGGGEATAGEQVNGPARGLSRGHR